MGRQTEDPMLYIADGTATLLNDTELSEPGTAHC